MLYDPKIDQRNQRLATVFDAMIKRLGTSEYAWCQDKFMSYNPDKGVAVCWVTALAFEVDKGENRRPFYAALARELPRRMVKRMKYLRKPPTTARQKLIFFNDHDGTDAAMVLDLIARARAKVPVP